jgi:hypothetical protein
MIYHKSKEFGKLLGQALDQIYPWQDLNDFFRVLKGLKMVLIFFLAKILDM